MQVLFCRTSLAVLFFFSSFSLIFKSFASVVNLPARYAVIIGARAGSNSLNNVNVEFVSKLRKFLLSSEALGLKPENIRIFLDGGNEALPGTAEADLKLIKQDFASLEKSLKPDDELWLFMSGYASASGRGYSLATRHGRLRGPAIKDFLEKVKGHKFVFCFTPVGSVLLSEIRGIKDLTAVSATSSSGQNSMPRLPLFFARRAAKGDIFDMIELIDTSVKDLKKFYESHSLLQAETAIMLVDGRTVSLPLGSNEKLASGVFPKMGNVAYADNKNKLIGDLTKPVNLPDSVIIKPANENTKKLLADAKAAAKKYRLYKAFFPQDTSTVEIDRDQSLRITCYRRICLLDDIAAERFSFYLFPKTARIDQVRIIYPDGRFHEPEPRPVCSGRLVRFPNAVKGSLIEFKYVVDRKPDAQLGEVHGGIIVQYRYPLDKATVTLELPEKLPIYYKLFNGVVSPVVTDKSRGKKVVYQFNLVPALEQLPYSPPATRVVKRVMFSSYQSWAELVEMIESLARSSRKLDEKTVAFVKKLTAGADSDTEKVRRIYNFLCDLRYETTGYGVGGLKPRNPALVIKQRYGDCKDKANALVTLAGAVGVKGYFALLNRGKYTDPNFPSWQFNHAMAYFPKLKGFPQGLWCDATDGSTVFGSLPPGDIGRNALLLEGDKSRFKQIFLSSDARNIIEQNIVLTGKKNVFKGTVRLKLSGLPDYKMRQKLKRLGPEAKRYLLASLLNGMMPLAELEAYEVLTPLEQLGKPLEITLNVTLPVSPSKMVPGLGSDIFSAFISLERPNGVVVNDGQPLLIKQNLKVTNDRSLDCSLNNRYDGKFIMFELKMESKVRDGNAKMSDWHRDITLSLKSGFIPGSDYVNTRALARLVLRIILSSKYITDEK